MVRKWFVHRRSEVNRTARPLGQQSPGTAVAGRTVLLPDAKPRPRVRTEVVVDRGNGTRKPHTVITIRRSGGQNIASKPPIDPKPPLTPESAKISSPLTPQILPGTTKQDDAQLEDSMESFGIETPASPSSTLRNEPEVVTRDLQYSPSYSLTERSASLTSVETSATAVDDGLSPWGLPKVLDPFEDDRMDDEPYEADDDLLLGQEGFDVEAELANIDSEFRSAHLLKAVQPMQSQADRQKDQLRKVRVMLYAMKLVASHKCAAMKASNVAKTAHSPQRPLSNAMPIASSKRSVFSTFASWI